MKKIPTLFLRDPETKLVTSEVTPGCEWVFNEENVTPTRKYNGLCCLIKNGKLYKRLEVKGVLESSGWEWKDTPVDFESVESDTTTGVSQGWVPVGDGPEDQWYREGLEELKKFYQNINQDFALASGTYDLCGPKIQGNFEGFDRHILARHGVYMLILCPKDFEGIKKYLVDHDMEGIVWYGSDGKMAKIKKKDFGLERKSIHTDDLSWIDKL